MTSNSTRRRSLKLLIGIVVLSGASLVLPDAINTSAVNATVSNLSDDVAEEGSFRWAIAQVLGGTTLLNRIDINPDLAGRIVLESDLPQITKPITINGPGQSRLVIDGDGHRIFDVAGVGAIGAFVVRDVTIAGGRSPAGGAIEATASTIVVEDVTFRDNAANAGSGGAINLGSGFLSVSDSTFEDNTAEDGGAISVVGASLTVDGSTFSRNSATTNGGSIRAHDTTIEVTGSTFDNNQATTSGGAIAATQVSMLSVTGSDFSANGADSRGGAVYYSATTQGEIEIERTVFEANTAGNDGGAVWSNGSSLKAEVSVFSDNVAADDGGAIYLDESSSASFSHSVLADNVTGDKGGGVYASPRPNQVSFDNSTISGNTASLASAVFATDVVVTKSAVTDNVSDESTIYVGGAPLQRGTLAVSNSTVDNNSGGAITVILSDAQISHSTLSGNTGPRAGAVELTGSTLDIDRSTFSGNTGQIVDGIYSPPPPDPVQVLSSDVTTLATTFDGDGVDMGSPGSFTMRQTALDGPLRLASTINITAEHSASSATMPTGTASTNSDFGVDLLLAMFADNGGDTATVLPGPGSPLIDRIAGTVTSTTDQRGLARPSGSAADIGAAEIQGGQIAWSAASDLAEGANGVVQLNRTGGSDPLSVRVIDVARTAERGVDYAAISQLVAWDAGETGPKTVPISALSDAVSDNGETFDLTIEASGGATVIGSGRVTVTIADVPDVPDVVPPGADRPFVKPLPPARVVDTRTAGTTVDGVNQGEGRRASDASIEIDLAGRASVPTDARAVVLNLTAIRPDTIGFVTLYPCGDRPLASSLNFAAGSIVGNEVITGLSAKGTTCIYTSAGTDITVDVVGFVPASSPVAQVTPARLLESRANQKTIDGVAEAVGRFDANGVYRLQVSGRAGIPDGAAAAILNVTAVGPAGVGFVSVHPCLDPVPLASSLNYVAGANRGNEIIAQLSNAGEVCFFTSEATHLTVDVVGWIPDAADYAAVAPARLVETREGQATVDGTLAGEGRRPAGSVLTVPVTGRAGVPAGATAAVINLTAINAAGTGFFTVWNCEGERPLASSLNYSAGVNGGNEVVAGLNSAGELCVYTFGDTHMSIDIVGYTS